MFFFPAINNHAMYIYIYTFVLKILPDIVQNVSILHLDYPCFISTRVMRVVYEKSGWGYQHKTNKMDSIRNTNAKIGKWKYKLHFIDFMLVDPTTILLIVMIFVSIWD